MTANRDFSFRAQLVFDPLVNTITPPCPDRSIGTPQDLVFVGATQAHTMQSLRQRLPQSIFLLPGYGTQGATAEMTRAAFKDGKGAIVSASRSILYAHREKKCAHLLSEGWEKCVEQATRDMAQDISSILR